MSALVNQVRQLQAQADAGKLKASKVKKRNAKGNNPRLGEAAAAAYSCHPARVGMGDLVSHRISWIAGTVFAGITASNGTSGSAYFRTNLGKLAVVTGPSNCQVPILSSNAEIGRTYVSDIKKHYSRQRVKSLQVRLVPLQPSTANNAQIFIGPVRGLGTSEDTFLANGGGIVAASIQNVLSMSGAKSCASWEQLTLDLTPYIAGGTGAKQNEFNINADGANSTWGSAAAELDILSPASFVIGGNVGTATLYGTDLFLVVIDEVVDLLDYTGGIEMTSPESLVVAEAKKRFEATLQALCPFKVQEDYAEWQSVASGKPPKNKAI